MKTIDKNYENQIDIKKSQFICRLYPAQTESEAKEIIAKISAEYKDATHNCSAYYVSDGEGYDDDGEPGGTAGRPMLNVLKKNELQNSVAIVTRYFGGIKLGAGGLVRAYSKSVLETLAIAEIVEMEKYHIFNFKFDYQHMKLVDSDLRSRKIDIIDKTYDETVNYKIAIINKERLDNLKEKLAKEVKIDYIGEKYLKKL